MGMIQALKASKIEDKRRQVSLSLKAKTVREIEQMAKEAKVNKSAIVESLLETAIVLEKGGGLDNYAKAFETLPAKKKGVRK